MSAPPPPTPPHTHHTTPHTSIIIDYDNTGHTARNKKPPLPSKPIRLIRDGKEVHRGNSVGKVYGGNSIGEMHGGNRLVAVLVECTEGTGWWLCR